MEEVIVDRGTVDEHLLPHDERDVFVREITELFERDNGIHIYKHRVSTKMTYFNVKIYRHKAYQLCN